MSELQLPLMTAIDIPIPECKLILHQPTITELSYINYSDYLIGVQTLCINKSMFVQDKKDLDSVNNFQIFMMVMTEKETKDKKKSVLQLLSLLFPNYKVIITPQSLLFNGEAESIVVDEKNFDFFQNVLKEVFCQKNGPMDQTAFNPANAAAQEIARKLMKGRERIAAEKGDKNSNILVQYASILSVALHVPVTEIVKYTLFQFYDTIERYSLWINWDLDIRTRLAGGKPDSHPDNWMKNIH